MQTIPCVNFNELAEMTVIAGSYKELFFYVYTSGSIPVNLSGTNTNWNLTPYEQTNYIALTKTGINSTGYFKIVLNSADTINLRGKYIQEVYIQGASGYEYRPARGVINFIPALGEDGYA